MFEAVLETLLPLKAIAKELRTLRVLYELELSSRDKPLIRVTEKPKRSDTEISYAGEEEVKPPSALQALKDAWNGEAEEEGLNDD
jgi:hypothetical protein